MQKEHLNLPLTITFDTSVMLYAVKSNVNSLLNEQTMYDINKKDPYLFTLITKIIDPDNLNFNQFYSELLLHEMITYQLETEVFMKNKSLMFNNPEKTLYRYYNRDDLDYLYHAMEFNKQVDFSYCMNDLKVKVNDVVNSVIDKNSDKGYYVKLTSMGAMFFITFYFT